MSSEAKSLALRWLSQRSLSIRETKERLVRRGFTSEVVNEAVQDLLRLGLLDDAHLAADIARQGLARHHGPRHVLARLIQRGIDPALGRTAMAEELADVDWLVIAEPLTKQYDTATAKGRDRLMRHLAREGFPAAVIRELTFDADRSDEDDLPDSRW